MPINFLVFDSVANLKKYVEQTIAETKSAMGVQMRNMDEVKKKSNPKGKSGSVSSNTRTLEIAGFKVLVNPTVEHELQVLEEVFSSLQDRLEMFEKIKELYPHMTSQNLKIGVIVDEGLPTAFMFFTQD